MLIFDGLPAAVRRALAETVAEMKANPARAALDNGATPDQLAAFIRRNDAGFVRSTTILTGTVNITPIRRRERRR